MNILKSAATRRLRDVMPLSCQFYLYDDRRTALQKYKTRLSLDMQENRKATKVGAFDELVRLQTKKEGLNITREYAKRMDFNIKSKR